MCEPAIVVKNKSQSSVDDEKPNNIVIDLEKFSIYIHELRETYSERIYQNIPLKSLESDLRTPDIFTKSDSYYHNLIGVANLFLDVIYNDLFIPFEYDLPVINQQGQLAARLKVCIQQLSLDPDTSKNSDDSESLEPESNEKDSDSIKSRRNFVKIRLCIFGAYDLSLHLNNHIFCDYQFWDQKEIIVPSVNSNKKSSTVSFNHVNEFTIEANEEFMDFCQDKALSIKLMAHRLKIDIDQSLEKSEFALNQYAKYKYLIDAWSEVSKSFELNVKILELNHEGQWRPVNIKQSEMIKTGGIYELKQGQSRQVSVSLMPVKKSSPLWYNGLLFNMEPHKIDKISIGSICGKDMSASFLDSYQEIDLVKLKEKCHFLLEKRKEYLKAQINQSTKENSSEEEKERCNCLHNQLFALGDEQAAVDAPMENTHLPGSTIQWSPGVGMEKHVPVIFLDINSGIDDSLNSESDLDLSDNDELSFETKKNSKFSKIYGDDCFLSDETNRTSFIPLKIVSWTDSNRVEMNDLNQKKDNLDDLTNSCIKSVARWDSTEHQSVYLDKETPLDRFVFLTVKVNLKLKLIKTDSVLDNQYHDKYVNLVLRKRICVSVYSTANSNLKLINFSRIKGLLGSTASLNKMKVKTNLGSNQTKETAITYRLILGIPKVLSEIENRESLAVKAAISVTENLSSFGEKSNKLSNDNSNHFEYYAKKIEAVESILKQDRIQQQIELKKAIISANNNLNLSNGEDSHSIKKTSSVPNLLLKVNKNINKYFKKIVYLK